jgi:prolipoprotein diacylglyceryltransferase
LTRESGGQWQGLNLTYYGLFNAHACTLAVGMVYLLLAASSLELTAIHMVVAATLLFCVPAAIAAAYALGEGCGRLACISFGCCYGRPLDRLPAVLRRLLTPFSVVYHGTTKKIAYAGHLDDKPVVAVQAITAFCSS